MEKTTQMRLGGGILALLLAVLGSFYFSKNVSSEADAIRQASVTAGGSSEGTLHRKDEAANLSDPHQSGNIPGTNVNQTITSSETTLIKYEEEKYDFGTVDEGAIVKHSYKFKNTGDKDLLITNAKASCGCTVPNWPKQPIPPGGTGSIDVEFNTSGKPGNQNKTVTVTANTNPTQTFIQIGGIVRSKEQPAAKGQ